MSGLEDRLSCMWNDVKRRPGAGTLAHGNRQHHNTEEGSVLARKQKHACSF